MVRYILDLDFEEDKEVIKTYSRLKRLPSIKRLSISYVNQKDNEVKSFLNEVSPKNLQEFSFAGGNIEEKHGLCDVKYYLSELQEVLTSTIMTANFYKCTFCNIDLCKIFSSASHLEELWFSNCQFNIEEEFIVSKQEYNIKRISMLFCGDNKHSGWVDQVDKLECLAKAVSNSSLCYSLKQIHIHDYDLDEKKVKLIFERHGLQRIIDACSM